MSFFAGLSYRAFTLDLAAVGSNPTGRLSFYSKFHSSSTKKIGAVAINDLNPDQSRSTRTRISLAEKLLWIPQTFKSHELIITLLWDFVDLLNQDAIMVALSLMLSYVLISSRVTSHNALLKGSSENYYIDIQKTSSYLVLDKQCDQGLGTGREQDV